MWEGARLFLPEAAGYVEIRSERSLVRLLAVGGLSDLRRAADRRRRRRIQEEEERSEEAPDVLARAGGWFKPARLKLAAASHSALDSLQAPE